MRGECVGVKQAIRKMVFGVILGGLSLAMVARANERNERYAPIAEGTSAVVRSSHTPAVGAMRDDFQLDLMYGEARYRLCPSDVLAVKFPQTPGFDQTVTIEPDGSASMAEIGGIHLGGLTADEALGSIKAAYSVILKEPMVTLELKDFKKPFFIVSGEVRRPGKYDLRGFVSITEALATAGGFSGSARTSSVLLFRRAGDEWYAVKELNLKKLLEGRAVSEDVEIRAGDMIVVPVTTFSKLRRMIF